jgi:hypothetical protein
VHAVVDASISDPGIESAMHAAGFKEVTLREITASLEDVFVTLTEQEAALRGDATA